MPELNIGIGLTSLRQPFKKALHTAAHLGATGIEIDLRNSDWPKEISDTGRRQLRKMLEDLNLRVASARFPTRRGYDQPDDLQRRIDATKSAMKAAYELGTRVLINSVGQVPEDKESAEYSQLKESLSDLARFGAHCGTMLACETGSEPVDRLIDLLNELPELAIGVAFNPANLIVNGYYDMDSIRVSASRTLVVQACDATGDMSRGRGRHVLLGQGSAEFPEMLGVLEDVPYRGWFVVDRPASSQAPQELADAIQFLRSL